ncbi:MAG TPA: thioredoxin family protein [Flavisolibacter sp.]|nr:thioredoxin family protein [Flavisolibacter sp.]
MKSLVSFLLFLTAFIGSYAQSKVPSADEVLLPVYAQAGRESKKVLLIFHASWCGWCRKMDSSLQDRDVKPLIDHSYITTHLTVYESPGNKAIENPGALELLTKHGGADQGLPYWIILDKDGKLLADAQYKPGKNSGCPANEEEVAHFIQVLKKTSSLNDAQLKVIAKRFRMNDQ